MNFYIQTFLLSFIFNFIWENAHATLYSVHLGQKISEYTLFVATLGDVLIIMVLVFLFKAFSFLRKRLWLVFPIGISIAVAIEKYDLMTNRWVYNDSMPIIPYVNVGLTPTPTLQLAIGGFLTLFVTTKTKKSE